jgi:hypothetical protein
MAQRSATPTINEVLAGTKVPSTTMAPLWTLCASGAFTFLVCVLRSFILPHTPILSWGDGLGYATKGERLAQGELPYRDFFDFVSTGTDLIYAGLFHTVGVSVWAPVVLMCFVAAAASVCLTWLAGRMLSAPFVPFPALLFTGFVLWGSLDPTHHWFSTLAALGAVAALFDGISTRRVLAAGLMCGVVATFTQSSGAAVLCALLVYLWYSSHQSERGLLWKRSLLLCGAALLVFTATNGPFLIAAGLDRWIADVIVFPLRYFGSVSANNWHGTIPDFTGRKGLLRWIAFPFLYVSVPLAYAWTLARVLQRGRQPREGERTDYVHGNRALLLAIVGLSLLVAVTSAPSIRRLSCASPPAMILLVWLLSSSGQSGRLAAKALTALSVAIAIALIVGVHLHRCYSVTLPAGKVAVYDPDIAKVYSSMAQRTKPAQWFFGLPSLTLPLKLRNPTPIEAPAPGDYTRPQQIAEVIAGLERTRTPLLLLRPSMYVPHILGYRADHLQPFHDYLFAHYRRTSAFETGDEVWERLDR